MSPLRARVEKGRLVLDEPTTLPDGTIIDLVADDEGDDLKRAPRPPPDVNLADLRRWSRGDVHDRLGFSAGSEESF